MTEGKDLKLRDIVKVFDGPYGYATVKKIEQDTVVLFRPYVAPADYSYSGGVICYVGIEEFSVPKSQKFEVVELL